MDALEARKPLVVVVNDALMDNHQAELAEGRHRHHSHMVAQQLPDHRQQLVSVHAGQHHIQDHLQRNGGGPRVWWRRCVQTYVTACVRMSPLPSPTLRASKRGRMGTPVV